MKDSKIISATNSDCTVCDFKRAVMNKHKGVKIPDGAGKCTNPGGLCEPKKQKLSNELRVK